MRQAAIFGIIAAGLAIFFAVLAREG